MLEIKSASTLQDVNKLRLIYSAPGIGKTSTIKFLEGKTLVVDIDRTTSVLKGQENIDIVTADTMTPFITFPQLLKEINDSYLNNYNNIVIDNISELERSILAQLGKEGKNNRVPSMANYQQMQFMMIDAIRYLKSFGKNILITAWETSDQWQTPEGQIYNRSYPQISNKILTNAMGLCDVVARLIYDSEEEKRWFILQPTNAVFAKNQIDSRKGCKQEDLFKIGDIDAKA
ncbi:AAA family ATPase [Listeria monocytogenes]|nr:AAA family ATPase [Listeria monocytogenes]